MYRLEHALPTAALLLAGCFVGPAPETNDEPPDTTDPACQITAVGEQTPGYPYDLAVFGSKVLPVLTQNCAAAGCHGAPQGQGAFTVWEQAAQGNCDYAKTFNALAKTVDLTTPANSRLLTAINGTSTTHPVKYGADDPKLQTLTAYANAASATYQGGGGGVTPPPGASPFDYAVYQSTIQPIFDTTNCAVAGCHGTGAGTFTLAADPSPASAAIEANFIAATARTNLASPVNSVLYVKATTAHAGGSSAVIRGQSAASMLAWIEAAAAVDGGGGGGPGSCAPADLFNLGVFRDEIYPILAGDIDLNNPGGSGTTTGCVRGPCHGTDRGAGTLFLSDTLQPQQNLQNFACFVSLGSPSTSEMLTCPSNSSLCKTYPHPGQDVFQGAADFNYKRVLSYLYGSKVDASPLDFAFFVREVNPIFSDVNAVENGAQGRSCADAASCHGISVLGQQAANGSNFPVFENATDEGSLAYNFVSASSFVNFLDPGQSSLFLYPTNEIADVVNNPLATGLPHPGGTDFAVDSREAGVILKWAGGLRPNAEGFITDWLVAGDYPATQISDLTAVNEITAEPKIFDATGVQQFNNGVWDGLFNNDPNDITVDLNGEFPRAVNNGRIAYAVTYITNTSALDIQAQLEIRTPNAVRVYVNGQLVAQSENAGQGVVAIANLPAYYNNTTGSTRVMIKLLQRAQDQEFQFDLRARDEFGNLLTDLTGELFVQVGPGGGL